MSSYNNPSDNDPSEPTSYVRKNAWNSNGTFDNPDLLWYAKGVGALQSRSLDDPNSWWFFAAIHGQYINRPQFPGWGKIPAPPAVPVTPVPSASVKGRFWDQCQHQSWYFAPWHRGYLIALEAQIREAVISLNGPSNWALPYWNYFGPDDQFEMPPAFAEQSLPDGTPNPLFVSARYGPNNDGDIFVGIPPVAQVCENNTIYTGTNAVTPLPGFGGPDTGFSHSGQTSGNLEDNPHNQVHGDVGGFISMSKYGLMSDPGTAALDPIFYLHHCNIDRMWAAWNDDKGNSNPTDPTWIDGPAASGQREFVMPMPGNNSWVYTPGMVNSLSQLNYTYDDLTTTVSVSPSAMVSQRLSKLGAAPEFKMAVKENMDSESKLELVGAHDAPLEIKSSGVRATVKLDSEVQNKMSASLESASEENLPDHVYVQLENVRGNLDPFKLNVSVNQRNAGSVSLFGLRRASEEDGEHGGSGLTFILDITHIIDNMFLENSLDTNALDVRITPNNAVPEGGEITVGRVSVYRQGQ